MRSNSDRPPTTSSRSPSPLTSAGALPPSNWRTCRLDRPKMAIVRPQPQVTVTQRSPSPMPFGNGEKTSLTNNNDERKSKLPLATSFNFFLNFFFLFIFLARYRSVSSTSLEKSKMLQDNVSPSSSKDCSLNKYRLKNPGKYFFEI